ncbi:cytochrome P450 [Mycena alexandri]|uniref:Cytochrome P450 n=1 Tax=Mycena alexandri TaxID=1745969 RepID=A0AAD6XFK6_9AGAR|nr:cytochrome P450 [Mycena alexandri]
MMWPVAPSIYVQIFAVSLGVLLVSVGRLRKKRSAPPGPDGLPFIGNLLDLPKREAWQVYLDWSKHYDSDILSMKVPGAQFFILNSAKVIQDLLVKKANIYSNRPHSTLLKDLIGITWLIPFMNNGERWREHRRLFRREFETAESSVVNKTHEVVAARKLLRRLLRSADHEGEIRLAVVDAIMSTTYGISLEDLNHPFVRGPEGANAIFADVARGEYIVDVFPLLRYLPTWVPGTVFHTIAKKGKALADSLLMDPYGQVQAEMANGTACSSVASRFLSADQDGTVSETEKEVLRNVCGNAYLGGADTIVCSLYSFVIAMALYPDVQKKAQISLDAVLEGGRLPEFEDFLELPYLSAVINEVLRWHPVTPFANYHASTEDDAYEGYHIPKGAIMIPNTWAILHDERIFGPDTDKFDPERFLKADGSLRLDLSEIDVVFGFSKRACPGRVMAKDTLWIMMASILTAYTIADPFDMDGNVLTAESHLEYTTALVSFPPHIRVSFKPRIAESVIHESLSE